MGVRRTSDYSQLIYTWTGRTKTGRNMEWIFFDPKIKDIIFSENAEDIKQSPEINPGNHEKLENTIKTRGKTISEVNFSRGIFQEESEFSL